VAYQFDGFTSVVVHLEFRQRETLRPTGDRLFLRVHTEIIQALRPLFKNGLFQWYLFAGQRLLPFVQGIQRKIRKPLTRANDDMFQK
jgi:hypothetical protein